MVVKMERRGRENRELLRDALGATTDHVHLPLRVVCMYDERVFPEADANAVQHGPGGDIGAGLWVARQLTSRLEFLTTPAGRLTTRLWA
jgi:hypothetical protein